jgi:phosphopantothenoylcysteine decarboxylase/phosphopantothenate--cysteine ligase
MLGHSDISRGKWLVTAGPTREAIDPVRYISNHSTGKMGYAVAAELAARGADVVLVSGPTALPVPAGVKRVDVVSAEEMWRECVALWPQMDGAVMCAAVADYTPAEVSPVKIKKERPTSRRNGSDDGSLTLLLMPTKDIAAELGRTKRANQLLVGFALETDNEQANALDKMARKNLDMIVLNSLRDEGAGFGGDTNRITIFSASRTGDYASHTSNCASRRVDYPLETKSRAAAHIVDGIIALLG